MPNIPTLSQTPNLPTYRWNAAARNFIDRRGRFVPRDQLRAELDQVMRQSAQTMRQATEQLRQGQISLADWQQAMMQQIKTTHLAGAIMQAGGWNQMSQADFGRVGRIIRDEYGMLRNFAAQIASGRQKLDGTLLRRAAMYGEAGRATYYRFAQLGFSQQGYDEERSVLTDADHCEGCVREDAKGFQPLGSMVPIGQRICLSGCRCRVEYQNSATGETVEI